MRKPSVGIVPEGLPVISLLALATLACAMLRCGVGAAICFLLCAFAVSFFRNPDRVVNDEKEAAVSPADGRIVAIRPRQEPFSGQTRQCVSIFMNVFNVHVNRAPVGGLVTGIRYHEGKFINASLDKASEGNERCAWEMMDEEGDRWTFVQIAGLIARRIVPWAERGDTLGRGQRFGMIRFGSRVDLYLPEDYTPVCRPGQRVFAAQTVLARKGAPEDFGMTAAQAEEAMAPAEADTPPEDAARAATPEDGDPETTPGGNAAATEEGGTPLEDVLRPTDSGQEAGDAPQKE